MVDKAIGECPKNPRGTGHCEHTHFTKTTAGEFFVSKCCWCGRTWDQRINVPEHGTHV